jgi:Holliday junction resolvase RusA-like endonuclease
MIGETVDIALRLPPRVLSPNAVHGTFGGRMKKASATKKYRQEACEATEECMVDTAPWDYVEVQTVFYYKDKRRRDPDNALASLKAAFDGIVDAGLVKDDDWDSMRRLPPIRKVDRQCPRVELIVTHVEKQESV